MPPLFWDCPVKQPKHWSRPWPLPDAWANRGLFYGFHLLAPFPGTAIGDDPDAFGLKVLSRHWPDYHANRAICLPAGMDPSRLDAIAEEWQTRFLDYLDDIQNRMRSGKPPKTRRLKSTT
jgi:hypothetical protein